MIYTAVPKSSSNSSHTFASKALMQLFLGNENREELAVRTKSDLNRSELSCIGFHSPDASVDVLEWRCILYICQLPTVPQGQGRKQPPFTLLWTAVLRFISQQQRLLKRFFLLVYLLALNLSSNHYCWWDHMNRYIHQKLMAFFFLPSNLTPGYTHIQVCGNGTYSNINISITEGFVITID